MGGTDLANKRVVGLVSGNGTGKTSLAECLLLNAGIINKMGSIETKNTVSDYNPLETKKGFSITSSIMHYNWKNSDITVIDSPGYMDFMGQSLSTMKVIDGMLLVIDVKSGLQAATERIIEYFKQNPKPAFCIINKMDQENVNYNSAVEDIRNTTGLNLVPITIPSGEGENFSGIIDLLQNQQYDYKSGKGQKSAVDESKKSDSETFHNNLIESIVETNDDLLNKYLEGEKIDPESINKEFKNAVIGGKVIPTFAVSSGKNIGIDL